MQTVNTNKALVTYRKHWEIMCLCFSNHEHKKSSVLRVKYNLLNKYITIPLILFRDRVYNEFLNKCSVCGHNYDQNLNK